MKKLLYILAILISLVATIFLATFLAQCGVGLMCKLTAFTVSEEQLYSFSGSIGIAVSAIIFAAYVKVKKYSISKSEKFNALFLLGCILLSICICKVMVESISARLFSKILPVEVSNVAQVSWVETLFAILIAPLFEELLFRYSLYNLFNRKFSKLTSILVCSLLFAIAHAYQWQGFVSCLGAGIVFTLIYADTGNIGYSVASHIGCNAFVSIMNLVEHSGIKLFGLPLQYEINGYNMFHPVIIGVAILIVGIYAFTAWKAVKKV